MDEAVKVLWTRLVAELVLLASNVLVFNSVEDRSSKDDRELQFLFHAEDTEPSERNDALSIVEVLWLTTEEDWELVDHLDEEKPPRSDISSGV